MRPALFFDRDNTLIATAGYLGDPDGVVLIEGAAEAIARGRQLGFAIVVASNQSGVARGFFTEQDVHAVNRRMEQLLLERNGAAIIDYQTFCPYHPEASVHKYRKNSDLRKPKPGLLLEAARKLDLDVGRSWMIGDTPRDVAAGQAAGCRTILVELPGLPGSPAASEPSPLRPDYVVSSLGEAMDVIAQAR